MKLDLMGMKGNAFIWSCIKKINFRKSLKNGTDFFKVSMSRQHSRYLGILSLNLNSSTFED